MAIQCELYGPLRETVGRKTVELSLDAPTTVHDVLTALSADHDGLTSQLFGPDGELRSINITVNQTQIEQQDGLETDVADGDIVRIAPPVRGGARPGTAAGHRRDGVGVTR